MTVKTFHPSIKAIKKISNDEFSFATVDREKMLKDISSLDHTKACQESDIPIQKQSNILIKEYPDIFSDVLHLSFNASVNEGTFYQFSNWLMLSRFTAQKIKFSIKDFFSKCDQIHSNLRIFKKVQRTLKIITGQLALQKNKRI